MPCCTTAMKCTREPSPYLHTMTLLSRRVRAQYMQHLSVSTGVVTKSKPVGIRSWVESTTNDMFRIAG